MFDDTRKVRADFFVYTKSGGFAVDVFYPKDRHNLTGCLNIKMNTYSSELQIEHPVIFLMLNEQISEDELGKTIKNKRRKFLGYQQLMGTAQFMAFCEAQIALAIAP